MMIKIKIKPQLSLSLPKVTCVQLLSQYPNNAVTTKVSATSPLGRPDPKPACWQVDKCICSSVLYIWKTFLPLPVTINYTAFLLFDYMFIHCCKGGSFHNCALKVPLSHSLLPSHHTPLIKQLFLQPQERAW